MFRKKIERTSLKAGLLAAAATVLVAPSALAQTAAPAAPAPADEGGIEDIVVVAQHRDQNLQDVPIAVTAVTAAMLDQTGIDDTQGLNLVTPNLNVVSTVKTNLVYLRGVGNNSSSPSQEQTVSIYIDGVYIPSMAANVFQFNNIERVEVLRGPQGTLFGRNSTGGLVHVITHRPSDVFEGNFSLGYGNYNTAEGSLYLTGPLTDTLSADFAIQGTTQQDGWGRNIYRNVDVNLGDSYNVRTKLLWEPTNDTSIMLSLGYFETDQDFGTARNLLPCAQQISGPCIPVTANQAGFNNLPFTSIYDTQGDTVNHDENQTWLASLQFEQDIGVGTLVSTTGYVATEAYEELDSDSAPFWVSQSLWHDRTASVTQEVQLRSNADAPFDWIVGYFYFHSLAENWPNTAVSNNGATRVSLDNDQVTDSHAVFAQATFPLTSATNLTLGGRYTYEERQFSGYRYNETGAIVTPQFDFNENWSSPTYRVAIDHHFNDNFMMYASVSTGFKSGLFNPQGFTNVSVEPEEITDYEIGFKADLLDRRLRVNGTAFRYDYTNIQGIAYDGLVTTLRNAAEAELEGVELEFQAIVTDALSVRGNVGWMPTADFVSFPGASENTTVNPANGRVTGSIIDASGNRMSRTPEVTAGAGFDYTWSLGANAGDLVLASNIYYNDGFYFDNAQRLQQESYSLLNASLLWTAPDGGYSVRLWANNLNDEAYCVNMQSGNNRLDACAPAAPRTYGITFNRSF